ncbi:MAG: HD domain-containing protein [Bdellovibrionales bacterium]|nr:HD domain-containing protein [Bdellovibrionales bacterium]
MEVRDPIHGSIEFSKPEVRLLDSVPYQRLRSIKQLGFSEFSFPGATHNRFLHSLGVCHLAGLAFDLIFKNYPFKNSDSKKRMRQATRLAALLHDIGHGPLSHTTEEVMPILKELKVGVYKNKRSDLPFLNTTVNESRQANHEDYTIKFVTDSELSELLKKQFPDIAPLHVACLIDKSLACPDDFFKDGDISFRTILSQLVSSEMDVDRMDYLERDAYFCGTNYGKVELEWLLSNLTYHEKEGHLHLALNRRALYTFDDFLLARHHMHLMVYFHHKSIIYEEMLHRYLSSPKCQFHLPADIDEYVRCTDYALYQHLQKVDDEWAQRISKRKPYKNLFELHSSKDTERPKNIKIELESAGLRVIHSNSQARLSKYHTTSESERAFQIFVVDGYDRKSKPYPIEESTEIFQKYEEIRQIDRLYVAPEDFEAAEKIMIQKGL